jgi:hypothetical protein
MKSLTEVLRTLFLNSSVLGKIKKDFISHLAQMSLIDRNLTRSNSSSMMKVFSTSGSCFSIVNAIANSNSSNLFGTEY